MSDFNKEDKIRELLKVFAETDEFYTKVRTKFKLEIFLLFHKYYPELKNESILDYIISMYANDVVTSTESVLDKDSNYPDYRKKEELKRISDLVALEPKSAENSDFVKLTHEKAKELVVEFFPHIQDMTGYGFRLLDIYIKMHHFTFLGNITHRQALNEKLNL